MAPDIIANMPDQYKVCDHLRPTTGIEEINPFAMVRATRDIIRGYKITRQCHDLIHSNTSFTQDFNSLDQWIADFQHFNHASFTDLGILLALASLWMIFRNASLKLIFTPLTRRLGVMPENAEKFTESSYKCVINLLLWLLLLYIAYFRGYNLISESMRVFEDWQPHDYPLDCKIGYFVEASYYVHAVYVTLYLDSRRKDFVVMMLHHFVTLGLMLSSYVMGYLKIGIIILFLDDISDVFLEVGKCASYLKVTRSGYSFVADVTSQISAVLFAVSWLILRVVFHVTKVWRTTALGSLAYFPIMPGPFYFYFNILIASLYAFYVYWFWYIVILVYALFTGQEKDSALADTRNYEDKKKDE